MQLNSTLANAIAIPPSAPSVPSVGYFTDGNLGTGQAATYPGAYWFHQIISEMTAILTAAGLTPSASDLTQLKAALSAGWDMSKSIAIPGWLRLPGGIIMQWKTGFWVPTTGVTITLPLAYPNVIIAPFLCINGNSTIGSNGWVGANAINLGQVQCWAANGSPSCNLFTLGY